MNILGFVSMLLIMLGIFFAAFQNAFFSTSKVQKSYIGYAEASRGAQNNWEYNYYKSHKKKPVPKDNTNKEFASGKEKKAPSIPKKTEEMPECARLNIYALFTEDQPPKDQYQITLRLLNTLYGSNLLKNADEKFLPKFLDHLIAAAKQEDAPKPLHLAQLKLKDPNLQPLFYKMLKGAKNSYPSLLDYIKISSFGKEDKICLSCANHKMLAALFGEKAGSKLEQTREEKLDRLQISKAKLEEIVLKETNLPPQELFMDLVKITHKSAGKNAITATGFDGKKATDITVKKRGYLSDSI